MKCAPAYICAIAVINLCVEMLMRSVVLYMLGVFTFGLAVQFRVKVKMLFLGE